jgi:predicted O-methyltransferase YrrM
VLEFGSGMSTIWYAKHVGEVCSVEDCKPWFDKVGELIESKGIKNINLYFATGSNEYSQFMPRGHAKFDLIMVDGNHRSECIAHAINLLKPYGILYLDNSDRDTRITTGDTRLAEELALQFAREQHAQVTYFTDFAPTQFFVQQGLMIKLPTHA